MTRIKASPQNFKARITTAEFLRMSDAGVFDSSSKIELIDGELERMPPPYRAHSLLQGSVYAQLVALFGAERVCMEIGIDLGNDTVVGCDVVLLRSAMIENRLIRADEIELAVEIAETTLKKDTGIKLTKYASGAIPTYWVVDGARSLTHVYRQPIADDYARFDVVQFGQPIAVPGTDATIILS